MMEKNRTIYKRELLKGNGNECEEQGTHGRNEGRNANISFVKYFPQSIMDV